jgi:hypothetical protein
MDSISLEWILRERDGWYSTLSRPIGKRTLLKYSMKIEEGGHMADKRCNRPLSFETRLKWAVQTCSPLRSSSQLSLYLVSVLC